MITSPLFSFSLPPNSTSQGPSPLIYLGFISNLHITKQYAVFLYLNLLTIHYIFLKSWLGVRIYTLMLLIFLFPNSVIRLSLFNNTVSSVVVPSQAVLLRIFKFFCFLSLFLHSIPLLSYSFPCDSIYIVFCNR